MKKRQRPTKEEIAKKIEEEVAVNIPIARQVLENNLYKFNKFVLKVEEGKDKVPLAPFHQELCTFVETNKHKKKLVLVPRGHLKSTLVTVGYSLQQLLKDPSRRILIANATYNLACNFLTDIKRQLKFNDKIHLLWGDLSRNPERWSSNEIALATAKGMHGKKEPNITAMGLESNLTSQHYDVIIGDDLVNKDYVNTADQIQKTINFYKEALNLLEPNGEFIIIGTRWHDSDLYGWIMDNDNNVLSDFEVMVKQAYEGDLYGEDFKPLFPAKFKQSHLKSLREQQGPYFFSCTPAETPILMADFTEKPISEIKAGDEIIGFERGVGIKKNNRIKTVVKNVFHKRDIVYDLKMKSGRIVRCTKDHRWYTGRKDITHNEYLPPKKGRKLLFVCPTQYILSKKKLEKNKDWETKYWSWLGGIFDGDGSAKSAALTITQGVKNVGVCSRIRKVLRGLDIPFEEFRKDNSNHSKWSDSIIFSLGDNFNTSVRFIRNADFAKKWQVVKRLLRMGGRFGKGKDDIISMKKGKEEDVYALETETGNYVAWGYASSNSQYMNDPIPDDEADFKRDWFSYYDFTDLKGRPLNKFTMIDPAISTEKESDFTAIVTAGVDDHNNIYILDIRRIKANPQGVIDEIFKVFEQWHPILMGIEEVAFQKALRYSLHQEMNNRNLWLPLREVKPQARTKDQRIRGLQPLYANKKVYHNKGIDNNMHLEDELLRFPRGKHDDVADALSYGLDFWYPGKRKVSRRSKHKYLYA
jgi:predicted phage terminase large subunit-like protein